MPAADVSFSAGEIALIGVLLSAVIGPLGLLFKSLMQAKDDLIKTRDEQINVLKQDKIILNEDLKANQEKLHELTIIATKATTIAERSIRINEETFK